jgi:hypothetical protein
MISAVARLGSIPDSAPTVVLFEFKVPSVGRPTVPTTQLEDRIGGKKKKPSLRAESYRQTVFQRYWGNRLIFGYWWRTKTKISRFLLPWPHIGYFRNDTRLPQDKRTNPCLRSLISIRAVYYGQETLQHRPR